MNYGDIFTTKDFTRYSIWAYAHNAIIEDLGNGTYKVVESDNPKEPTAEEIKTARANMYQMLVDPVTCHIQRLGDEQQTAEIMAKIAELRAERTSLIADINLWLPYPAEPVVEEPLVEPIEASEDVIELAEGSDNEVIELYSMEI